MSELDKKVQEYKNKLLRINNIKKQLIDCEINWLSIVEALGLSFYEYRKLQAGDLEEREAEVLELIDRTPEYIKNRGKRLKTFQKIMIDLGTTTKEFCKREKIDMYKLNRTLRNIPAERDREFEKKVERALKTKLF